MPANAQLSGNGSTGGSSTRNPTVVNEVLNNGERHKVGILKFDSGAQVRYVIDLPDRAEFIYTHPSDEEGAERSIRVTRSIYGGTLIFFKRSDSQGLDDFPLGRRKGYKEISVAGDQLLLWEELSNFVEREMQKKFDNAEEQRSRASRGKGTSHLMVGLTTGVRSLERKDAVADVTPASPGSL